MTNGEMNALWMNAEIAVRLLAARRTDRTANRVIL